jgi:hypothetical protein
MVRQSFRGSKQNAAVFQRREHLLKRSSSMMGPVGPSLSRFFERLCRMKKVKQQQSKEAQASIQRLSIESSPQTTPLIESSTTTASSTIPNRRPKQQQFPQRMAAAAAASPTPPTTNKHHQQQQQQQHKKPSSRSRLLLLGPTSLALAVLGGAAAALVGRLLLPRPRHDPSAPSHFLAAQPAAVTASRVPIDLGGAQLEATVLVAPAAPGSGEKEKTRRRQPVVMALHGFPDDAATYHAQLGPLNAAGYDVVMPVLPGYEPGTAGRPPAAYSLPSVAHALGQVAEWAMRERGGEKVGVRVRGRGWGGDGSVGLVCFGASGGEVKLAA